MRTELHRGGECVLGQEGDPLEAHAGHRKEEGTCVTGARPNQERGRGPMSLPWSLVACGPGRSLSTSLQYREATEAFTAWASPRNANRAP